MADNNNYASPAYRLDGIKYIKELLERSRNDFMKLDNASYGQLSQIAMFDENYSITLCLLIVSML